MIWLSYGGRSPPPEPPQLLRMTTKEVTTMGRDDKNRDERRGEDRHRDREADRQQSNGERKINPEAVREQKPNRHSDE